MTFEELPEFEKDLKKLLKKYRTINDDLFVVKTILKMKPHSRPPFSFRIDNIAINTCIIKIKKMACRSLKGRGINSGLRLIYAHFETEAKIVLIEIYHKSDKPGEDRNRITDNFT